MGIIKQLEDVKKRMDGVYKAYLNDLGEIVNLLKDGSDDFVNTQMALKTISAFEKEIGALALAIQGFNDLFEKCKALVCKDVIALRGLIGLIRRQNVYVLQKKMSMLRLTFIEKSSSYEDCTVFVNKILDRWAFLEEESKKGQNALRNVVAVLKSAEAGGSIKDIFKNMRSKNKTRLYEPNGKAVHVSFSTRFSTSNISVVNAPIKEFVFNECNNLLKEGEFSEAMEEYILSVRSQDYAQLEGGLSTLLMNTVGDVIMKHSDLLRTQRVNVYVRLVPPNMSFRGEFFNLKSNFSHIFIVLALSFGVVKNYILGKSTLDPGGETYNAIVHELTHAFDTISTSDELLLAATKRLLNGKEPISECFELTKIISKMRSEGFARLSGGILSLTKGKNTLVPISIKSFLTGYEKARDAFEEAINDLEGDSPDFTPSELSDSLYRTGVCHNFGEYMMLIVFIDQMQDDLFYFEHDASELRKVVLNERDASNMGDIERIGKYIEEVGGVSIEYNEVGKYIEGRSTGKKYVHALQDSNVFEEMLKKFMIKMASMHEDEFLEKYFLACTTLRIINPVITRKTYEKIYNHQMQLLKEAGFE